MALKGQLSSAPGVERERKDSKRGSWTIQLQAGKGVMDGFNCGQWLSMRDMPLFSGPCTLCLTCPSDLWAVHMAGTLWPLCKGSPTQLLKPRPLLADPPPPNFHTVWPDGDRVECGFVHHAGQGFQSANSFQDDTDQWHKEIRPGQSRRGLVFSGGES